MKGYDFGQVGGKDGHAGVRLRRPTWEVKRIVGLFNLAGSLEFGIHPRNSKYCWILSTNSQSIR